MLSVIQNFTWCSEVVNAHPIQPHVRIENDHTWVMRKSGSGTLLTSLSLRSLGLEPPYGVLKPVTFSLRLDELATMS